MFDDLMRQTLLDLPADMFEDGANCLLASAGRYEGCLGKRMSVTDGMTGPSQETVEIVRQQ